MQGTTPTAPTAFLARAGRRAAGLLVNLAIAAVLLVSAGFVVPGVLGYERYVIVGNSMASTFERGAVAFEELVPVADLEVGDVITYQPPAESGLSNLVTHRIVSIRETPRGPLFRTRGDANGAPDPWTFRLDESEQPRVVATVPLVGHAFIALADRDTRMLAVGLPAALVALHALVELLRMLVRGRRRTEPGRTAPAAGLPGLAGRGA